MDRDGIRIITAEFDTIRAELTERFGGVTAFVRSPALGTWADPNGMTAQQDEMVLVEVVVNDLDRAWWASYRTKLERLFRQDEIMMRAWDIERI
jgi:hypothetical protein